MEQCENCGTFWSPGQQAPGHVEGCPNQDRPYGMQPSPTHSEMDGVEMPARNIPAPGMEQKGGNPLREGDITGEGWQPAMKRDESFASYHPNRLEIEASFDEFPFYIAALDQPMSDNTCPRCGEGVVAGNFCGKCGAQVRKPTNSIAPPTAATEFSIEQVIEPGPHTVEVDAPGSPIVMQHDDPDVLSEAAGKLGKTSGLFGDIGNAIGDAGSAVGNAVGDAGSWAWNHPGDIAMGLGAGALALGTGGAAIPEELAGAAAAEGGAAGAGAAADAAGTAAGTAAGDTGAATVDAAPGMFGKVKGMASNGISNMPQTLMNHAMAVPVERSLLGTPSGGGQSDPQAPPIDQTSQMMAHTTGLSQLARIAGFGDDFEHPNSIPKREDTDDPEDVDPHEVNDGDHKDWQKQPDVNGIGGTTEGTTTGHDPETSDALGHFTMLLPLLHHYHKQGPGAGANDPMLQLLDQMLEGEVPGYRSQHSGDDPEAIFKHLFGGDDHQPKDEAGNTGSGDDLDSNDTENESGDKSDPTTDKDQELPGTDMDSQSIGGSTCKHCGEAGELGLGICPHCGGDQGEENDQHPGHEKPQGHQSRVAGITDVAQLKAVKDLLVSKGRQNEIESLIDNPDAYTPELLEVQKQQPEIDSDQGAPPPSGPPPGQDPSTPPGAGMPMPAPPTGIQPMGAAGVNLPCPKCDGHTVEIVNPEDGDTVCKSCGHSWKSDVSPHDGNSTHMNHASRWKLIGAGIGPTEGDSMEVANQANPTAVPEADQHRQHNIEKEQDSSMSWVDASGQPLQVGSTYLIHSPKYSIPERATITSVKPHAIEYTQTGTLGLDKSIEVTKQESDMDALEFIPADGGDAEVGAPGLDQNADYAGQADPGYQDDLADSSDYRNLASVQSEYAEHNAAQEAEYKRTHAHLEHLFEDNIPESARTAGANFTPNEQDTLIREPGTARNLDRLNLRGTHYSPDFGVEEDETWLW
jgi:hypothetical protein